MSPHPHHPLPVDGTFTALADDWLEARDLVALAVRRGASSDEAVSAAVARHRIGLPADQADLWKLAERARRASALSTTARTPT